MFWTGTCLKGATASSSSDFSRYLFVELEVWWQTNDRRATENVRVRMLRYMPSKLTTLSLILHHSNTIEYSVNQQLTRVLMEVILFTMKVGSEIA